MLLAILFLPVALVVITIGLPVLILIASMGVMGIVVYSHICTKLSGCTKATITNLSSPTSLRIVLPTTTSYRYHNDHSYYYDSRTILSPPPSSSCMMLPEYRMSTSVVSPLRFRYKSNMASAPPSPTSSMHDINKDRRNQEYDRDAQFNRRRRVRFA